MFEYNLVIIFIIEFFHPSEKQESNEIKKLNNRSKSAPSNKLINSLTDMNNIMDNSLIIQETAEENDLSRKSILKSTSNTSKVGKLKTVRPVTYTQTNRTLKK